MSRSATSSARERAEFGPEYAEVVDAINELRDILVRVETDGKCQLIREVTL